MVREKGDWCQITVAPRMEKETFCFLLKTNFSQSPTSTALLNNINSNLKRRLFLLIFDFECLDFDLKKNQHLILDFYEL